MPRHNTVHTTAASAALVLLATFAACADSAPPPPDPAVHRAEVEAWRAKRDSTLRDPDGWLTLVGLHWLNPGNTTFGSAPDNDMVYDRDGVPARIGTFTLVDGVVTFAPVGVDARLERGFRAAMGGASGSAAAGNGGAPAEPLAAPVTLASDAEGAPDVVVLGSLSWFIIDREGELAVRLKDRESAVLTGFTGVEDYPIDEAWRLPGRFEWHDPPKEIQVPNVLGGSYPTPSPASVVFRVDGEEYRLDLWKDSDDPANFFTAFGDATNGGATYGGGRFLWVDAPGEDGWTVVDFNEAYNPPCVFTPYATCPIPPRQNRLPFEVEAGEKVWGHHPARPASGS